MGVRRKAREHALQALFSIDVGRSRGGDPEELFERFCKNFVPPKQSAAFFRDLVTGVLRESHRIDPIIERFSENWKIHRMSGVDRNILRIAVYEMLHLSDVPDKVTINEAVELGKKFGAEESGAFINGILDSIRIDREAGFPE